MYLDELLTLWLLWPSIVDKVVKAKPFWYGIGFWRSGSCGFFVSPAATCNECWLHTKCFLILLNLVAGGKKPLLEEEELEEGKEKEKKTDAEARPVSYSYMFFHLIFALASMYSAMLLSGWTNSSESSDLIDVGWTSVWVRICTEWVTAALFVWSLVAPLIFPDREFF